MFASCILGTHEKMRFLPKWLKSFQVWSYKPLFTQVVSVTSKEPFHKKEICLFRVEKVENGNIESVTVHHLYNLGYAFNNISTNIMGLAAKTFKIRALILDLFRYIWDAKTPEASGCRRRYLTLGMWRRSLTFRTLFGVKGQYSVKGRSEKVHFLQGKVDLHSWPTVVASWPALPSSWFLSPSLANGPPCLPSWFSAAGTVLGLAPVSAAFSRHYKTGM